VIRTKKRDELQRYLSDQGIQTLIHYPVPPHRQNAYKEWHKRSYPITEQIHREVLSLPMSPVLKDFELKNIADVLNDFKF
jgi:dTDP-4-amino-4,6-dideoxygalactose transaminase